LNEKEKKKGEYNSNISTHQHLSHKFKSSFFILLSLGIRQALRKTISRILVSWLPFKRMSRTRSGRIRTISDGHIF
jgi:hypothetical protein